MAVVTGAALSPDTGLMPVPDGDSEATGRPQGPVAMVCADPVWILAFLHLACLQGACGRTSIFGLEAKSSWAYLPSTHVKHLSKGVPHPLSLSSLYLRRHFLSEL